MKNGYPSHDKTHLEGVPAEKLRPQILPLSIYMAFLKINENHMDGGAIEFGDSVKYKYDVSLDSRIAMKSFLTIGIKKNDCVAFVAKNSYEMIISIIAVNAIGAKVAILNPDDRPDNILEQLRVFRPKVLFTTISQNYISERFAKYVNSIRYLIKINPDSNSSDSSPSDFIKFGGFMRIGANYGEKELDEVIQNNAFNEDIVLYLQTSGSKTGKPKILPFTNRAIFGAMIYASNSTGTKTNDSGVNKVLCIIPMRLPYGFMTVFVNLMGGNTVLLADGATPEDIGKYYLKKPSYIYGTPLIFKTFMKETPKDVDLSFLTAFFCSGFAMSEEWYQEGMKYLREHNSSAEIRNNYGIGEGMGIGTASDGVPHKPGMSGKFYVGPKWLLLDEKMNEVKYGEEGEAYVWAETLCKGYLNDPEKTAESFRMLLPDGLTYYKTGDMMILYEDGYVQYVGRKERFYQPIGATDKVNCKTVEDALLAIPSVSNSAVIIEHTEDGCEYGHAFVEANIAMSEDYMRGLLSEKLLSYQIPEKISVVKEIPIMKSGKVDYAKLSTM